ncbi:N-acetylmuramoyl-L-alanine amidase [Bacillus sp. FJAT-50079]|uniref:N-acetylmuramoyl-L-alanine amidase n=1 Tax=Bacillus sp. FJAT-50079 TaxID=2833577 RepID=UPI001BCA3C05|nr:N-acetylmuramoyl-L-alanine amidase [Bacillus sp. FJAT-50079]MBS4207891.1 N-acetylmuramoyl-L-alanine amidase [Bacillus sp. FJAT-50079]
MEIKQQLVSSRSKTFGAGNPCNFITIHETANQRVGAGAQMHANLQSNGYTASWHYQVDDKEMIQSFPDEVRCWHAGDGQGKGNGESIGIEICVNSDSDFRLAIENTAKLVRYLMEKHQIAIGNVVQHNHWSGKDCPHFLRSGTKGVTWAQFIQLVQNTNQGEVKKQDSAPSTPVQQTGANLSIVDWMNANQMDSSFSNRARLAKAYGIQNYTGTAVQNIELMAKLRAGSTPSTSTSTTSSGSIVDYMNSNGMDSSFANRKKLAEQYGITPYSGTAAQNLQLLNRLKNTESTTAPQSFKTGQKVKLKSSAQKYATGENIPSYVKNKTYTIQQVKANRVLLKEIYSWVNISDIS